MFFRDLDQWHRGVVSPFSLDHPLFQINARCLPDLYELSAPRPIHHFKQAPPHFAIDPPSNWSHRTTSEAQNPLTLSRLFRLFLEDYPTRWITVQRPCFRRPSEVIFGLNNRSRLSIPRRKFFPRELSPILSSVLPSAAAGHRSTARSFCFSHPSPSRSGCISSPS